MLPWIASGWIIGLFVGAQWQPAAGPLLLAGALLGTLPLALHRGGLGSRLWVAPLAGFAFLCGLGVVVAAPPPCRTAQPVEGTAEVDSVRYRQSEALVRLRLRDAWTSKGCMRVPSEQRIEGRTPIDEAPPAGSVVSFEGEIRPRTSLHNPSPHPSLSRPRRTCWVRWREEPALEVRQVSSSGAALHRVRARVRRHLTEVLPQDAASVARALVLGDGGALGYERRKVIAAVGLAHLFAVSGLHIALVSGTVVGLLRWLLGGLAIGFDTRRVAAALGVPLTLLHAAFAGGSPSASRAAVTAAMTWGLIAFGRRPSATAITAAAALVLSVPDPAMALRPAFLLSIVATSAILSAPRPTGRRRGWRWIQGAATVSARTLVATAPMVWWWFGGVPLVGWLANIVVLPFGSWVVIPLAHLVAATAWAPGWSTRPSQALTLAVEVLLDACERLLPLALTQRLPPLDPAQGLVVLVACALMLGARSWRSRVTVIALAAVCWLGAERALVAREQPRDALRVSFVDVGQGDATLVDLPDGRLALIDTGQGGRHPASRALRSLLAARRRTRIDLLVITHGHPDHYGGLPELLDSVELGEIWLNGQLASEERDGTLERLLNQALRLGTKLRFVPELCGTTRDFGGALIEVLWPCPGYDPTLELNDNSLTLRLAYGARSFLLTGDLEAEAERRLVASRSLAPADVLKVAHHGSRTSTTEAFVDAVRPKLAVISSGAGNRYGHPSPTVLKRLREAGTDVRRTDLGGGVVVTTDGESLEIGP